MKLNNWAKCMLVFICFGLSVVGFMIKLPSNFRHIDKELHTAFYFFAAAFLNLLFVNKKLIRHIVIFISLLMFGIIIEYSQELSNKLLHKKIHGRFDVVDVHANLKGLVLFSLFWIIYNTLLFGYKKLKFKKNETSN